VASYDNMTHEWTRQECRERLGKFGLELHADKTRLIEFGRAPLETSRLPGKRGLVQDVKLSVEAAQVSSARSLAQTSSGDPFSSQNRLDNRFGQAETQHELRHCGARIGITATKYTNQVFSQLQRVMPFNESV
jgi:hypothetical protein